MNIITQKNTGPTTNIREQSNRNFVDASLKRREQEVQRKEREIADEKKRLREVQIELVKEMELVRQSRSDLRDEKMELKEVRKEVESLQERLHNDSKALAGEREQFDKEKRKEIVKLIIDGFLIAVVVGVLVNQITDIITYSKNFFWNATAVPSELVYGTFGVILALIFILWIIIKVKILKSH